MWIVGAESAGAIREKVPWQNRPGAELEADNDQQGMELGI
jgi:hypothetical protein